MAGFVFKWGSQADEVEERVMRALVSPPEKKDPLPPNYWRPSQAVKDRIDKYRIHLKKKADRWGPHKAALDARKIAQTDLFYLCHQVLGFADLVEPLHADYCDFLMTAEWEQWSTLTLFPRSHYKTTIGTTGRITWRLLNNPELAIGLGSATLKDSRPFGRDLKQLWEKNGKLKALFPDIFYQEPKKEAEKWTEEEFTIKRQKHRRESTITLFGLEEDLPTGRHFDRIVLDDAINKDNVRTPERLEKLRGQMQLLPPLLVTLNQPIDWVGTHYHVRDIYMDLKLKPSIHVYIRKAIENGKPIFPEKFNIEALESLRQDWGNYLFSSQYLLEPQDPADKRFRREWLKYYESPIYPYNKGMVFFMAVDPASRRRKSSDFTAMLVFGIDSKGHFFLVDGVHDKLTPWQRIEKVLEMAKKWKIHTVAYETIGFQETDKFSIERAQLERNIFFRIVEITSHKERKDERIQGLAPIMQQGRFHLPAKGIKYRRLWESPDDGYGHEVDIVEQFLIEFDFFPDSTHDDLLDVAQMARQIVHNGYVPLPEHKAYVVETAYGKPAKKGKWSYLMG